MRYDWECQNDKCGAVTEVYRTVSHFDVPPLNPCRQCNGNEWKKVFLSCPDMALQEAHNSSYPLVVPGFEKKVCVDSNGNQIRDELNRPVVKYEDIVFKSKKEQDAYMNKNGLVRTLDGRDPEYNASRHSHYDQTESPAPTPFAEKMAKEARFVEPKEVFNKYVFNQTSI